MDDTRLALIETKLDQVLAMSGETKADVRSLHEEHRALQLTVAELGLEHLKEAEKRFAPLGRFSLLERTFYGLVVAALIGLSTVLVRDVVLPSRAEEPVHEPQAVSSPH